MRVTADMIKQLRELSSAGVLDCKGALEAAEGDMARAQEILKERGLAKAEKKADREARQGLIEAYVHLGKAAGVVEVNCETDFVARTPGFKQLAHDLAMQVVAANPSYVKEEDVPAEVLEREAQKYRAELAAEGKPEDLIGKIVDSKLAKFRQEICLLSQLFIKDPEKTVKDIVNESVLKNGENIVVRRFVRLELNEN